MSRQRRRRIRPQTSVWGLLCSISSYSYTLWIPGLVSTASNSRGRCSTSFAVRPLTMRLPRRATWKCRSARMDGANVVLPSRRLQAH
ncbi:hypothetical protein BDZ89DRAFT_1058261 [Hymenopellis radicata]|nr:hypothetical protein BDZ89DRAFT_1058261 [Hymenopellis radicata]